MLSRNLRRALVVALIIFTGCARGTFGPSGPEEPAPSLGELPCEVARSVRTACASCHDAQPLAGAPMALVSIDDFQRPARTDPSRPVWQLVRDRLADPRRPMPPPPALLSDEDRGALDAWLEAGATRAGDGEACPLAPPPEPEVPLPCAEFESYHAHAALLPDEGFEIPGRQSNGGDLTACFTFKRPAGALPQASAWGPLLDNRKVLHHINLYAVPGPVYDGAVVPCQITGATYLMGWEPGRPGGTLPDDIGLELPDDAHGLLLEVHYHNVTDRQLDASGMRFCTTPLRPTAAGVITLGTESIHVGPWEQDAVATGLCPSAITGQLTQPLNVLSSAPHMHATGASMETDIVHADGSVELAVPPDPWDPHHQPLYTHAPALQILPGDRLVTTCHYVNPEDRQVGFGGRATDEMCYSYNLVYPLAALPPRLAQLPLRLCDCRDGTDCTR
jgi:hypothetical protein